MNERSVGLAGKVVGGLFVPGFSRSSRLNAVNARVKLLEMLGLRLSVAGKVWMCRRDV